MQGEEPVERVPSHVIQVRVVALTRIRLSPKHPRPPSPQRGEYTQVLTKPGFSATLLVLQRQL